MVCLMPLLVPVFRLWFSTKGFMVDHYVRGETVKTEEKGSTHNYPSQLLLLKELLNMQEKTTGRHLQKNPGLQNMDLNQQLGLCSFLNLTLLRSSHRLRALYTVRDNEDAIAFMV